MANLPANSHMFHLRRIAPNQQPSHQDHAHSHGASNLHNQATLLLLDTFVKFGRNHELCDVVLTSSFSASNMISRDHAEITGVKTASGRIEKYHITDHSLNGTYINDRRCRNRVPTQINEGDIIKFGHMNGASIKENQMAPQASAEFAFVVERAMAPYQYLGFRDGRRVHPIICRGDVLNCSEGEQRTIDAREPINTSVGVKSSSAAMPNAQLLLDGSTTRPVQPVPPTAHLTAAHHHLGALPSSSTTTPSVVGSSIPPSGHHHSSAALNTTPAAASPSTLNFFPYGTTNLASFYPYSGLPSNLFAPANSITQWNLQQAQAAISGFRAPNVFGSAGLPPATSSSFLQRGFLPQASSALVNSLLTPVTAAAVLQAQAQHQHHQQQQHQQQQQQHQQQQHDAAALAAAAAASVASVSHPVGKTAAEQYQQQLHAHQQQQLQQQQHQIQLQQQHLQSRVSAPAADTTLSSKPTVEIRQQTATTMSVHMPAKAAPPVVATAPVVAAPAAPPAKVTPIASPPMECDSSVPSPPKAIVAADSSTNSQTIGVQPISGTTKLPSPTNLRKEDDQRSERSFAESPPPRRAPAPAPWDSTPSPRPRDTPDRDSVAKEKEQQQKEKEKQREEERKADNKKPAAAPVTKHRKTNEIARLLDDLTETSWANQVKRVSTNSRRPAEEVLLEKSAKKEKKKKEKERARREREETEQQQQRKSALAQPPSSSTGNAANASSSSANRLAATDPKRRLKQLSDEESVSSSDSSEEGEGVGTGERRRLSSNGTSALSSVAAKKEAMKRRKSSALSSDEESSESSSDDDAESDDSSAKKKNKKRARKSSTSATSLKANKLAASKKRSSVGTATGKGKPGKAARKKSSASYSSPEPEPVVLSAQATVDENGDPVTHHDPTSTCGLAKQCTRPQDEQVNWICCDDCDTWYHNICILGHEEAPTDPQFFCGCSKKSSSKGSAKKLMKKKVR